MHMTQIQSVLNEKKITFSYTEEDNCGSIDFEHRGLRYHIWEFADDVEPVGVETNLRYAGRDGFRSRSGRAARRRTQPLWFCRARAYKGAERQSRRIPAR